MPEGRLWGGCGEVGRLWGGLWGGYGEAGRLWGDYEEVMGWLDLPPGVLGPAGSRDPRGERGSEMAAGSLSPPAGSLKCPPGRHRGETVQKSARRGEKGSVPAGNSPIWAEQGAASPGGWLLRVAHLPP